MCYLFVFRHTLTASVCVYVSNHSNLISQYMCAPAKTKNEPNAHWCMSVASVQINFLISFRCHFNDDDDRNQSFFSFFISLHACNHYLAASELQHLIASGLVCVVPGFRCYRPILFLPLSRFNFQAALEQISATQEIYRKKGIKCETIV